MIKFDEWEFKSWLDKTVGYDIRKHTSWGTGKYDRSREDVNDLVKSAIADLDTMDLVCYLGEYLTKDIEEE